MCLVLCYLIWHIRCVRIADKPKPKLNQTQQYHQLHHTKLTPQHHTNKHFLSSFSVPLRTRERKIVNKYIYQSYNKDYYYNNNHYIGNLSCLCVVCPGAGVCVPGGSSGLLKLSQPGRNWQAWYLLASW